MKNESLASYSTDDNLEHERLFQDESEHPYKLTPTKSTRNAISFPAITKFNTYLLRHYGHSIIEDVCERLYDGELARYFGVWDFVEDSMQLRDCYISREMSFWREHRYGFTADLEVNMEVDVCTDRVRGTRRHTLYVSVLFSFEDQITYSVVDFHAEKPDHKGIRLDDYLIPIMSYSEIEDASDEIWSIYIPEALFDRHAINAFRLADEMGLSIMSFYLYRKPRTRNILYWKDTVVKVIPNGDPKVEPVEVTVPGGTIVTNECLVPLKSRDLPIFHECFHAEYHWLFYRLQEMHNSDLQTIRKKRKSKNQGRAPKNPLPILEWEAQQASRAMMMPKHLILPVIRAYKDEEMQNVRHIGWALQNIGRRLSDEWGVPKYLVRSRMIHLGYWQAQGALNYVQQSKEKGNYIRPFCFDREGCPGTATTFVISPLDAFRLYEQNEEYRARIDSGAYIYVGGHVCLNAPQYVTKTKYGPRMTEWANRHVDECCLRFENVYEVADNYEFHLNCINSDEEYNRHYNDFIAHGDTLSAKEANDRQTVLLSTLPHTPGKALRQLMDIQEMTIAELAEAALVSDSTVKRWLREESSYKPTTALRIIVGLSLPPWISYWFIDMAKVPLQYTGINLLYREVINCRYMDTLREINELIEAAGYPKLSETD